VHHARLSPAPFARFIEDNMRFSAARSVSLLFGVVLVTSACARPVAQAPQMAFAPAMTVERFLRAANQNDLDTMGALFGTTAGSVRATWTPREVDERMFLLASLLRHTDYSIVGEQIVPGRREEATQLNVRLVVAQGPVQVPFTLVRARNQWLIENINIERITHPGRRP
jgi:hypothetical protein